MNGKHQATGPGSEPVTPAPAARTRLGRLAGPAGSAWRRLAGSASGIAVAFGALVLACAFLAVAGPRASAQLRTSAFRQLAASAPALDKTIIGTLDAGSLSVALHSQVGAAQLTRVGAQLRRNLAGKVPLAAARSDWVGLTTPFAGFTDHSPTVAVGVGTQFELAYRGDLSRHVRVLAGSLPAGVARRGGGVVVPVAITASTARRYGLRVGSRVVLPAAAGTMLQVTAIVAPAAPSAPFWQFDSILADPALVVPMNGPPYWQAGAFVPAAALPALTNAFSPSEIQATWMSGVALGHLTAAGALSLGQSLPGTLGTAGALGGVSQLALQTGTLDNISLRSGAVGLLSTFAAEDGAVGNVLDLLAVSLAVVGAVVVLLGAWLMTVKRREEFAVLRARGASRRQLAVVALDGCAVVVLPAAAAGVAAATGLTPGAGSQLAWWLGGLILVVALAAPVLITVRLHRGYAGLGRPDRPVRRSTSVRRLVAEAALVGCAAGGLLVLRRQGSGLAGGDLYASTAPVLIAVPVAIILLRLYPLVVRPVLLIASRRPGVTVYLGLARAARVSATSVLPVFAMVLALSLVSFAGMVRGAVVRGEAAQSWQETGADAVITVRSALTAGQQRAIAAVPGVQHAVSFGVTTAGRDLNLNGIFVLVADPAQYAGLLASTPLTPAPASFANWHGGAPDGGAAAGAATAHATAVPVLASAKLAAQLGRAPTVLELQDFQRIRVSVVGTAPAMSMILPVSGGPAGGYFVLPRDALHGGAPPPSGLLLAGRSLNVTALLAAVSRSQVHSAHLTLRSALLTALERAPLQHDAYSELALGGDAAAVACLLVLLLTLTLSAQSRQLTLARAATMGMSAAQARWLALIEALPQLLSVLIGGLICALALVPLVGPALSLSVFTSSTAAVPVRVEPAWLTATAIGLLALAIATVTGQTLMAGRGIARSLRIGS